MEVYLYDGWNRIATYQSVSNSPFTLHSSYTWGLDLSGSMQGAGGVGGLLKESEFDSNSQLLTSLYCLFDANGNVMQKLNSIGGTAMIVEYDPFGNIISGTLVGEYGFSTKPLIDNLDWYYYGFRYYDSVTGRWSSRDPIEEEGGVNIYGFLNNEVTNFYDPLGLCTKRDSKFDVDIKYFEIKGFSVTGYSGIGNFPDEDTYDISLNPSITIGYASLDVSIKINFDVGCECCECDANTQKYKWVKHGFNLSISVSKFPMQVPVKIKASSLFARGGKKKFGQGLKRLKLVQALIGTKDVADVVRNSYGSVIIGGLLANAAVSAECKSECK